VFGPGEQHKGQMASVVWHFRKQLRETGKVRLFGEYDGYAAGEQRRDFVYVDDVAAINLWFMQHPQVSGLYNVGTGLSRSFNDLARAVIAYYGVGEIEYIPFPDSLKSRYQSFTEADINALRAVGYGRDFNTLEQGIQQYLDVLESSGTTL
jgi:ADP-L-glycero-D-manno-heptose 6-epimerase